MSISDSLEKDLRAMDWLKSEPSLRQGQKEEGSLSELSVRILILIILNKN